MAGQFGQKTSKLFKNLSRGTSNLDHSQLDTLLKAVQITSADNARSPATAAEDEVTVATGAVAHSEERPQATAAGGAVTLIQHRAPTITVTNKLFNCAINKYKVISNSQVN